MPFALSDATWTTLIAALVPLIVAITAWIRGEYKDYKIEKKADKAEKVATRSEATADRAETKTDALKEEVQAEGIRTSTP